LTGVEAEGSDIPAAVPMQKLTPQVPEAAEGAPKPMEEVAEEAAATTGGEEAAVTPQIFSITIINANDQINRSNRSNTGQT
jgi:hypothetical protein